MNIHIITPAPPGSRAGNRATAERWAALLRQAGHAVSVITAYRGEPCDLFIALHTWRSHEAIVQFRRDFPQTPLIAVLTGTDIYDHQYRFPRETRDSMAQADVLIGLHDRVAGDIPDAFHQKLCIVLQSAEASALSRDRPNAESFDVCVIGHLRDEKDSLRAALAARLLPAHSRIRVFNAGKAHNEHWEMLARKEQAENSRFRWLGELDKARTRQLMAGCQAMVISSRMEGGANVVSEACRAGLPVIASDIPGNRGLLGDGYPGYFPVADQQALAECLLKAEQDTDWLAELTRAVSRLAHRFTPEAEQAALLEAIRLARLSHAAQ